MVVMDSLYDMSLSAVAQNIQTNNLCREYKRYLPETLQGDVLLKIHEIGYYTVLTTEIKQMETFKLLLRLDRLKLHSIFQSLMDCGHDLAEYYVNEIESHKDCIQRNDGLGTDNNRIVENIIQFSLILGDFLTEAGWYIYAESIYTVTLKIIQRQTDEASIITALDCCGKLLRVQNGYCSYNSAAAMVECVSDMLGELSEDARAKYNKSAIYNEIAILLFAQSRYDDALKHSLYALSELRKPDTSIYTMIDVMRLCSKGCVVKREFKVAERLIKQALQIAYEYFGDDHLKYADAIADYGFYLLNVDQVASAVSMYEKALEIRLEIFRGWNLRLATSHEELAYVLYVHEYNTGEFDSATVHAKKAISMLDHVLPPEHLLMGSAKRVRALILEEVANDFVNRILADQLLDKALKLHKCSLRLAKRAFGEQNLQTAKHYGNLGRLYQSMQLWEKAEAMHKRSIKIKESLLGLEDYEVALSLGHLASLYTYDMNKPKEAEGLYRRSVDINIKLFGRGYSGLQYDYSGLIQIYTQTYNTELLLHYDNELLSWQELRENEAKAEHDRNPLDFLDVKISLAHLMDDNHNFLLEQKPDFFCSISEKDSLLHKFKLSDVGPSSLDTDIFTGLDNAVS